MTLRLPDGRLVHSRVVEEPGAALDAALDRRLTGYAVLAPQGTLLLDEDDRGVLTFEDGVPVLAYHTGSDRGGQAALADLAVPGPYRCELYELGADDLAPAHEAAELRIPPGQPAERLAGDPDLAARTREAAPADHPDAPADSTSAVEAFLADEEKVEAIREQARREAERRAAEWGLDDQLDS